jgi:hypothetical protein
MRGLICARFRDCNGGFLHLPRLQREAIANSLLISDASIGVSVSRLFQRGQELNECWRCLQQRQRE